MIIHGTVTDATARKPLAQAKVVLSVGETELATLFTSKEGVFEVEQDLEQNSGQDLICHVEKEGFKPQRVVSEINQDEIEQDIKLVPEQVEITVTVRNDADNPLEGVEIAINLQGERIAVERSDRQGNALITIGVNLVGKSASFNAIMEGFEPTTGQFNIEKKTALTVKLKSEVLRDKPPPIIVKPPKKKWVLVAAAIGVLLVIAVVIFWQTNQSPARNTLAGTWNRDPRGAPGTQFIVIKQSGNSLKWKAYNKNKEPWISGEIEGSKTSYKTPRGLKCRATLTKKDDFLNIFHKCDNEKQVTEKYKKSKP